MRKIIFKVGISVIMILQVAVFTYTSIVYDNAGTLFFFIKHYNFIEICTNSRNYIINYIQISKNRFEKNAYYKSKERVKIKIK